VSPGPIRTDDPLCRSSSQDAPDTTSWLLTSTVPGVS
jgi:hypothetical protein